MKKIINILLLISSISAFSQNRDSLYEVLKRTHKQEERFEIYRKISDSYDISGRRDSSAVTNSEMFRIATELRNDTLLAMAYNYIGGNFMNTGDHSRGLEYQFKALSTFNKNKGEASCLTYKDIGVTYKYLKNYTEAIKYLRKAQEQLPLVTRAVRVDILNNRVYAHMAETFLGLAETDSALHYVQLAEQYADKKEDKYGFARTFYLYAAVYTQKGDNDLAESYYKKCIALSDSPRISTPYVDASLAYSRFFLNKKQKNFSKTYALKGLAAAWGSNNKLGVINAAAIMKVVYNRLQIKDSAYYYSDLKDAYRDSVFNEQQLHQVQNLTFAQQIKEKEDEAKLSEEKQQRKQNIQYAAIAIALITFVLLFLLLSRSIIVKTKFIEFFGVLGLLAVFEFINLLIHPYLAHATNDSPVLMLLVLIAIGALLIPLHHKLEKWITKIMVEKNKKIRLEAAKKTIQQLQG